MYVAGVFCVYASIAYSISTLITQVTITIKHLTTTNEKRELRKPPTFRVRVYAYSIFLRPWVHLSPSYLIPFHSIPSMPAAGPPFSISSYLISFYRLALPCDASIRFDFRRKRKVSTDLGDELLWVRVCMYPRLSPTYLHTYLGFYASVVCFFSCRLVCLDACATTCAGIRYGARTLRPCLVLSGLACRRGVW